MIPGGIKSICLLYFYVYDTIKIVDIWNNNFYLSNGIQTHVLIKPFGTLELFQTELCNKTFVIKTKFWIWLVL